MGLITKTAKVKWNSKNKKYYEALGYIFTKMGDEFEVDVNDLTKGSHIKVECFCDSCKEQLIWNYQSYNRYVKEDGKTYCRKCAVKLYGGENYKKTKLKNSKSFYDWCIENNRQDVLDRWDYELNGCSPKDVLYSTNKKYWFKCNTHTEHKSELKSIHHFTSGREDSMNCKQCNSIGQYILDKYEKDFLLKIWSDKNKKSPFEYSFNSNEKIWWNCPDNKHESFKRSCDSSAKYEFRCPECVKERSESFLEEKTRLYLKELGYEVKTEYKCSLVPINPKTSRPLPFDNEIVLENEKHLIIEVHGSQHYDYHFFMVRKKITKEEAEKELHYQKVKDRYKRIKCIQAGYYYLEIPYTAFDKKETYKKLIDDKIKNKLDK